MSRTVLAPAVELTFHPPDAGLWSWIAWRRASPVGRQGKLVEAVPDPLAERSDRSAIPRRTSGSPPFSLIRVTPRAMKMSAKQCVSSGQDVAFGRSACSRPCNSGSAGRSGRSPTGGHR